MIVLSKDPEKLSKVKEAITKNRKGIRDKVAAHIDYKEWNYIPMKFRRVNSFIWSEYDERHPRTEGSWPSR